MQLQDSTRFHSVSLRANPRAANASFRTAKNLGKIRVGQPFAFSFRSSLNSDNRVQVYKYGLQSGVYGYSSVRLTATGKGVRLQVLTQVGKGKIQPAYTETASPGSPFFFNNSPEYNLTGKFATFYLKFTLVKNQSNFRIQYVFSPAA
jgi:hypothetical protein